MPGQPAQADHYFDRFYSGLYTNRNPLYTPKRIVGISVIPQNDVLIGGLNMELTPQQTLARRPGLPNWGSGTFGSSEWPLAYYSFRIDGGLNNIVDTQTGVYTFNGVGAPTLIYSKTTTQKSSFRVVGNYLYWSDGTVNLKWDGATVWNNGTATPTAAPQCANLNFHDVSGHNQYPHGWSPQYNYQGPSSGNPSTFWFLDQNGNIQFSFINPNAYLHSANNAPAWLTTFGARTVDGGLQWACAGPITTWQASQGSSVYSFGNWNVQNLPLIQAGPNGANGVAPAYPYNLTDASGTIAWTGNTLQSNQLRSAAVTNSTANTNKIGFQGWGFNLPAGAVVSGIMVQVVRSGNYENQSTDSVVDLNIQLLKAGTLVGSNLAQAGKWPDVKFGVATTYGGQTNLWGTTWNPTDINNSLFGVSISATVKSTSNSQSQAFINNGLQITVWYTLASVSAAYYSTVILDSNGNLQRVKVLGQTGSSQPAWSTQIGGTTTDNTMTWECMGSGNLLAALVGWNWAYSFHCTTNGGTHTSTLGPQFTIAAPIIGPNVPLTGVGSDDPQVDTVDLYRNYDGGSLFYYDMSANNINSATMWTLVDQNLDTQLNNLLIGPTADANDPPIAGNSLLCFAVGRVWAANGTNLSFTAGPDCTNGDPNQSWPPANVFQFPENITAIVPTARGVLVFTVSELWAVLGGPQTLTFYPQFLMAGWGVLNSDCVVQDGNLTYVYTSRNQLKSFSFSDEEEVGIAIADQFRLNFNPATSNMTVHRDGEDQGLFISDGSTNVYRMDINTGAWSPVAQPVGGVGLLKSIETSNGTFTLLAGRATGSGGILGRSLTNFVDGTSSTYSGFATFGSMVMAALGKPGLASIDNIALEYTTAGSDMTVWVMPNEIGSPGSFTQIPFTATDPYNLPASSSIKMRRYDWLGVQSLLPNLIKHIQIKIVIPSENAKNELLGIAINNA